MFFHTLFLFVIVSSPAIAGPSIHIDEFLNHQEVISRTRGRHGMCQLVKSYNLADMIEAGSIMEVFRPMNRRCDYRPYECESAITAGLRYGIVQSVKYHQFLELQRDESPTRECTNHGRYCSTNMAPNDKSIWVRTNSPIYPFRITHKICRSEPRSMWVYVPGTQTNQVRKALVTCKYPCDCVCDFPFNYHIQRNFLHQTKPEDAK